MTEFKFDANIGILGDKLRWPTWSIKMTYIFKAKGLWDAVQGTDESAENQDKVKTALIMCLPDHLISKIHQARSAKAAWDLLKDLYEASTDARRGQLRDELSSSRLRMLKTHSVEVYINKAEAIRAELADIGVNYDEGEFLRNVLNGLPMSYDVLRQMIMHESPRPAMTSVLRRLMQREQDLKIAAQDDGDPEMALVAAGKHRQQQYPSGNRDPPAFPYAPTPAVRCAHCGSNHRWEDCGKLKEEQRRKQGQADSGRRGDDARNGNRGGNDKTRGGHDKSAGNNRMQQLRKESAFTAHSSASSGITGNVAAIDSGATIDLVKDRDKFLTFQPSPPSHTIQFGSGRRRILGTGTAVISGMRVDNAGFVENLPVSLISVSRAADRGQEVRFKGDTCTILDGEGNLLHKIPKDPDSGLYLLKEQPQESALISAGYNNKPTSALVWHKRLGHLSVSSMEQLKRDNMVDGFTISKAELASLKEAPPCSSCLAGRQQRNVAFTPPSNEPPATEPLDRLHSDLSGKVECPSIGGNFYVLTLLDDVTNMSWIHLLKTKDEAAGFISRFIQKIENVTGYTVKSFRSDRGTEYTCAPLQKYFDSKGIEYLPSAPYSPEQNGKAERLNRTLFEKARSMMHDAKVPKHLWGDAISTANKLRNFSPAAGQSKTPWELFWHFKPDISGLRPFGCLAHVHVPERYRSKLDSKSRPGIFVGYEKASWRIYINGKIIVSKDVIFSETQLGSSLSNPDDSDLLRLDLTEDIVNRQPAVPAVPHSPRPSDYGSAHSDLSDDDSDDDSGGGSSGDGGGGGGDNAVTRQRGKAWVCGEGAHETKLGRAGARRRLWRRACQRSRR